MREEQKIQILIIEDAVAVSEFMSGLILELWRVTPVVFPTGEQALSYLDERKKQHQPVPDLLIIDLQLPRDPQGMEILRKLKNDPDFRQSQVIIHTAYDDLKNKLEINQMENVRFVRKGLGHNALLEVLHKMKAAGFLEKKNPSL